LAENPQSSFYPQTLFAEAKKLALRPPLFLEASNAFAPFQWRSFAMFLLVALKLRSCTVEKWLVFKVF
jgi:hypothetical protein